jgi:hypothetical protein
MNKPQDQCVKLVREWNRADNALGCCRLSRADQATNELRRDRAESTLAVAKPESLPGAGCLVQHGTRALTGAITFKLWQSLLSIGGRLKQGELLLADLVALRRPIAAGECEPNEMEGELDVMDAGYKADVLAMLRRALGFV